MASVLTSPVVSFFRESMRFSPALIQECWKSPYIDGTHIGNLLYDSCMGCLSEYNCAVLMQSALWRLVGLTEARKQARKSPHSSTVDFPAFVILESRTIGPVDVKSKHTFDLQKSDMRNVQIWRTITREDRVYKLVRCKTNTMY